MADVEDARETAEVIGLTLKVVREVGDAGNSEVMISGDRSSLEAWMELHNEGWPEEIYNLE